MKKKIILLFILILAIASVNATTIGISPGILYFPNMIKEGYAEAQVTVSTSSPDTVAGHFEVEGEIKDWINLSPDSLEFSTSSSNPYRFSVIIRPPADAKNGNYTGLIRVMTDHVVTTERGASSAVIAAVALRVNIEIIGDEIILCRAGAFSVSDTEIDLPFTVSALVYNDGNVRLRPQFRIKVYDQSEENVLLTTSFLGEEILPTLNKRISRQIPNNLQIGQYFIDVLAEQCGITQRLTFDVVEKGGIVDKGKFIGIRTNEFTYVDEPTPILPVFRNEGPRTVLAKFKGEIISLEKNKIIEVIESDEIAIEPSQQIEFPLFFIPDAPGKYQISGRIIYNKKITFEEKSKVINVIGEKKKVGLSVIFLILIYMIIGLAILVLIGKIKKERKKFRR
ncbi:hypothetical protein JXB41_03510 [Candidatus Woesearchaeota archaeon]|nr:hypothetical protein [Candidatus Woesearchaeota archaeon]